MRKIINSTYMSLDGVIERPQDWPSLATRGGGGGDVQAELALSCDAMVMGRRAYEVFAPFWPTLSGDPMSDHINAMPKYVVPATLTDPEWTNTTVIGGDPVDEIRRLKEADGKDIVQYGFGQLSYALLKHGLLDELRLWVHPLFVGEATTEDLLFKPSSAALFELIGTQTLDNGIAILSYRVHRNS